MRGRGQWRVSGAWVVAACLLTLAPGCAREPAEAPVLELKSYRAGESEDRFWARGDDVRTAVITEAGDAVTIPGRGRFVTAVAGTGEVECRLNDEPVAGDGEWIEIRQELRSGATLSAHGYLN